LPLPNYFLLGILYLNLANRKALDVRAATLPGEAPADSKNPRAEAGDGWSVPADVRATLVSWLVLIADFGRDLLSPRQREGAAGPKVQGLETCGTGQCREVCEGLVQRRLSIRADDCAP
jgi:hypothetical protein